MPLKWVEITVILGFLMAAVLVALWVWRLKNRQGVGLLQRAQTESEGHVQETLSDLFDRTIKKCLVVIGTIAVIVGLILILWVLLSGLHYLWTHPLF